MLSFLPGQLSVKQNYIFLSFSNIYEIHFLALKYESRTISKFYLKKALHKIFKMFHHLLKVFYKLIRKLAC